MQLHCLSFYFVATPHTCPDFNGRKQQQLGLSWAFLILHTVATTPEVDLCCTWLTTQETVLKKGLWQLNSAGHVQRACQSQR